MMRRHNISGSEVGQGRPLAYMQRGRTRRVAPRRRGGRVVLLAALLLCALAVALTMGRVI